MPDDRPDALASTAARVQGAACRLARLATRAAVVGGVAGAVLWWLTVGDRVGDWWQGTAASVLVLAVCLAASAWLLNVRFALHELVELPDKLSGVAARRLRGATPRAESTRPQGGALEAMRSLRSVLGDYGDVAGSWGAVVQVVAPAFWLLTLTALLAVPILALLAAVAALINA